MSANLEVATETLLHANRNWGVSRLTTAHFWLLFTPCKQSTAESEMHTYTHWTAETSPQVRVLATKLNDLSLFDPQDLGGRGNQLPHLRDNTKTRNQ